MKRTIILRAGLALATTTLLSCGSPKETAPAPKTDATDPDHAAHHPDK